MLDTTHARTYLFAADTSACPSRDRAPAALPLVDHPYYCVSCRRSRWPDSGVLLRERALVLISRLRRGVLENAGGPVAGICGFHRSYVPGFAPVGFALKAFARLRFSGYAHVP